MGHFSPESKIYTGQAVLQQKASSLLDTGQWLHIAQSTKTRPRGLTPVAETEQLLLARTYRPEAMTKRM